MPLPQLYVARAADKVDSTGNLVDGPTSASLTQFLESFGQWIRAMQPHETREWK
jgi:hypothetical protein